MMYWRRSLLGVDNQELIDGVCLPELYLSTDDYAPFIKFDDQDSKYAWCVMRPFGTKYGSEVIKRFYDFYQAYNYLSDLVEKETGS